MKTLSLCAVILFSIFSTNHIFAQTIKKETIKVWGNCSMCKAKIEKAARSAGASTANWSEDTKELKVSYAVNKTSNTRIQQAIAKTGYDTQDFTADNSAYEKLHQCCQYERKDATAGTSVKKCCDKAGCKHDGKSCASMESCKQDNKNDHCKDMACCKEKSCCSKTATAD